MYVENIVIGTPIDNPQDIFATNESDWLFNEKEKTYFTKETYLPRILVDIGIYKSISEVRRNRPDLVRNLTEISYMDRLKVAKKRWLYISIGRNSDNHERNNEK